MKTKISPAVVGMFILGALLLGVIGFLSFGGSNIFAKPSRFVVYFDESVSGLDPGAAVKIFGVRVGRVAAVNVRYNVASKRSAVQTICELDRNVLSDESGHPIDIANSSELQTLIDHGLRAQLSYTGITGLLYVELEFEDPRLYPANPRQMQETYPVMPAIPSSIAAAQASAVEILANLKRVDFAGLAKDIRGLLASVNKKVDDFDVKQLSSRIGKAADSVDAFINSPDAKQTFAKINTAIDEARGVMARIDGQVGPSGDELRATLQKAQVAIKALEDAAVSSRRFIDSQGQLGDETTRALRQFADAAESLQRLADELERNPSSLIVGRKKADQQP
ncbi:MAG TPA: MlaD family protein [Candidatus Didemnitutus sp.]|nr:MlaD family protein [Candidatus Didemnitutus sp.]